MVPLVAMMASDGVLLSSTSFSFFVKRSSNQASSAEPCFCIRSWGRRLDDISVTFDMIASFQRLAVSPTEGYPSVLADLENVLAAVLLGGNQFVPGRLAECVEILDRARVGSADAQNLAVLQSVDGLLRAQN